MKDRTDMLRHLRTLALSALLAAAAPVLAAAQELRTNINADPAMIDPITYSELIAGDILKNMYEGFTDTDENGAIRPVLALRWEAHADNLGWRFHLRPNVRFHTGATLTARDVKATFEALLVPANKGGLALQYLERIVGAADLRAGRATELAGVAAVDDLTLDVRFTRSDVLFPLYPFMIVDGAFLKEKGLAGLAAASAGTGPFRLGAWRRGVEVALEPHAAYWEGAPGPKGVRFMVVPSDDTAINQFTAGDLDLVMLGTEAARRVLRDQALAPRLIKAPAAQITYLGLNQTQFAPFRDKRVREAFCIALDRPAMVRGLFGGLAEPLSGQITPGIGGYDPKLPQIAFDREKARRLFAEAGFPEGRGFPTLAIATIPSNRTESAYIADQIRQVLGVPVEINVMERGTFLRSLNAGEVPFFHWGWTAGYPDAMYYLSQVWHSKSPFNRARYANPGFDALIDQAANVAKDAERYKLYQQAERLLLEDWGGCGTTVRTQIALVRPNVSGVKLTGFRFMPFDKVRLN
jgi:oligopeptide transport system substrate-binding protein